MRNLVRASALVAVLTVVLKSIALVRESLVASQYGASGAVDAFVAAFLPISIGANALAGIASSLVPVYVRRIEAVGDASGLVRELLGPVVFVALAGTTLAFVGAKPVIAVFTNGYSAEAADLSLGLYYRMLPILPLAGLAAIFSGVLNANQRYSFVSAGPAIVPATVCVVLLSMPETVEISSIAAATTAGYALYAIVGALAISRLGVALWPIRGELTPDVRGVLIGALPLMGSTLLLSGTAIVDQVMVAELGEGSAARLSYGNRIVSQIAGLATVSIGTVLFPHFASAVARRDREGLVKVVRAATLWIAAGAGLLTLLLYLGSRLIASLLYGHGSMATSAVDDIALIQRMFALQLPFVLVGAIYVRLLLAFERGRFLLIGNVVSVVLNVVLNAWLRRHFGVAGIALSTSLVYACAFALLVVESVRLLSKGARWSPLRDGANE